MQLNLKYRGRQATTEDITLIQNILKQNPDYSRWRLSRELCKLLNWRQPNGILKDMVCRGYLLALDRAGYIELPPRKRVPPNPLANRKAPPRISTDTAPIQLRLSLLQPLTIYQVRRTEREKLFNSLLSEFHYLGYTQPVGEHLKYLIYSNSRVISCMSFSSAARHIGSRDRYIGWSSEKRKKNIHLLAYNSRFLIVPWVKVRYLASHILSVISSRISSDWETLYHHQVYYLETFVDTERFKGTCYRAANWQYIGLTTGRGKDDHTNKQNRSIKSVWGYPLSKNFREELTK